MTCFSVPDLVFPHYDLELAKSEKGGSDSFSGRRKLFWGNDDHLKSRAALSVLFSVVHYLDITSELQGHFP